MVIFLASLNLQLLRYRSETELFIFSMLVQKLKKPVLILRLYFALYFQAHHIEHIIPLRVQSVYNRLQQIVVSFIDVHNRYEFSTTAWLFTSLLYVFGRFELFLVNRNCG